MAQCIKTGAVVRIKEYNSWVVCDVYEVAVTSRGSGHMAKAIVIQCAAPPRHDECPREFTHELRIGYGYHKEFNYPHATVFVVDEYNLKELGPVG